MKERIISIDLLRGLSVMGIILGRFFNEWLDKTPRDYGFFKDFILFFAITAACFFLLISGMGYYLFINKRINQNISKSNIFVETIKRALFIFGISTLIQIMFGHLFGMIISNIIYWSIFQVIAFSMIIFFSFSFLKQNQRIILYIIVIILLFFLDFIISYYKLLYLSILDEGVFPFIPWANFYILGLLFGDIIFNSSSEHISKKLIISFVIGIISIITFFIWIFFYSYSYYYKPHFFPFFMLMVGIFIISFNLCYYYFDIKGKEIYFQKSTIRWGKLAFSIYYINWGVAAIGILLFPLIFDDIYTSGFLIYQYIILMIIFFISLEFFIRIWQRYNFFLGIEWLMNKISKKTLFSKKIEKE